MTNARYNVIGVGNAIVDVISAAPETLLEELGLDKGVMTPHWAERVPISARSKTMCSAGFSGMIS